VSLEYALWLLVAVVSATVYLLAAALMIQLGALR
jgi:hypothetical protein